MYVGGVKVDNKKQNFVLCHDFKKKLSNYIEAYPTIVDKCDMYTI